MNQGWAAAAGVRAFSTMPALLPPFSAPRWDRGVAGVIPAVDHHFRRHLGMAEITLHHQQRVRRFDTKLADGTTGQDLSIGADGLRRVSGTQPTRQMTVLGGDVTVSEREADLCAAVVRHEFQPEPHGEGHRRGPDGTDQTKANRVPCVVGALGRSHEQQRH
jgi:hypothetical protein